MSESFIQAVDSFDGKPTAAEEIELQETVTPHSTLVTVYVKGGVVKRGENSVNFNSNDNIFVQDCSADSRLNGSADDTGSTRSHHMHNGNNYKVIPGERGPNVPPVLPVLKPATYQHNFACLSDVSQCEERKPCTYQDGQCRGEYSGQNRDQGSSGAFNDIPANILNSSHDNLDAIHPRLRSRVSGRPTTNLDPRFICGTCFHDTLEWGDCVDHAYKFKHGLSARCKLCRLPAVRCHRHGVEGTFHQCYVTDVYRKIGAKSVGALLDGSHLTVLQPWEITCGQCGEKFGSKTANLVQHCVEFSHSVRRHCEKCMFPIMGYTLSGVCRELHVCMRNMQWLKEDEWNMLHVAVSSANRKSDVDIPVEYAPDKFVKTLLVPSKESDWGNAVEKCGDNMSLLDSQNGSEYFTNVHNSKQVDAKGRANVNLHKSESEPRYFLRSRAGSKPDLSHEESKFPAKDIINVLANDRDASSSERPQFTQSKKRDRRRQSTASKLLESLKLLL